MCTQDQADIQISFQTINKQLSLGIAYNEGRNVKVFIGLIWNDGWGMIDHGRNIYSTCDVCTQWDV